MLLLLCYVMLKYFDCIQFDIVVFINYTIPKQDNNPLSKIVVKQWKQLDNLKWQEKIYLKILTQHKFPS